MTRIRQVILSLVLLGGTALFGYSKSMYPYAVPSGALGATLGCTKAVSGMTLEPGHWYTNFSVCKAYADKKGIPLVAVWSNHGCIHCWYTDAVFLQDSFKFWQTTHDAGQVIYCFMAGGDDEIDQTNSSAYRWMWTGGSSTLTSYPFVALWWKKGGVNIHITGDDLCKGSAASILSFADSTLPKRVENVTGAMETAFAGWRASLPSSLGYFTVTNAVGAASYWVEPTTTDFSVDLVRGGLLATNQVLTIVDASANVTTQTVTWASSVTNQTVTIHNFDTRYFREGTFVTLRLLDGTQTDVQSETVLACVQKPLNDGFDTTASIVLAGSVPGRLSATDRTDVFRISGGAVGNRLACHLTSVESGTVRVELLEVLTGCTNCLADVSGDLKVGLDITAEIPSDACYLRVTVSAEEAARWFAGDRPLHTYEVASGVVLVPGETRRTYVLEDEESAVRLQLTAGMLYRFQGIEPKSGIIEVDTRGKPYYRACVSGEILLNAEFPGAVLVYQIWKPGIVGFTQTEKSVRENAGRIAIPLARSDGTSGRVITRVSLDREASTLVDATGTLRCANFPETTFIWEDGALGATNAWVTLRDEKVYNGDGVLVFRLTLISGAAETAWTTFTLNVTDNEKPRPGNVVLTSTEKPLNGQRTLTVRAGEEIVLAAVRGGYAEGAASVGVTVSPKTVQLAGLDANGRLSWGHLDTTPQSLILRGLTAGSTAKVSLSSPSSGFSVVSSSNQVSVTVVAADAPAFAQTVHEATVYRSVLFTNAFPVVTTRGGKVTFTKKSGMLPSGLKVTTDPYTGAMVVSGTATASAGTYICTYQIKEGTQQGLLGEFRFTVIDPTDSKRFPNLANAAVSTARTLTDLPVFLDETGELVGLLQVTIPTRGSASAKYTCASGTVSFTAKGWTSFDAATRTLTTDLTTTKKGYALHLEAATDGGVSLVLTDPVAGSVPILADGANLWRAAANAKSWAGVYTIAFPVVTNTISEQIGGLSPRGAGYLSLKMDTSAAWNAGRMTWAGVLPNGTTLSGTTILSAPGGQARLPLFKVTNTDRFSAYLSLETNLNGGRVARVEGSQAGVRHTEKTGAGILDVAYELAPCGGLWTPTKNLTDIFVDGGVVLTVLCSDLGTDTWGQTPDEGGQTLEKLAGSWANGGLSPVDLEVPLVVTASALKVGAGAPKGASVRLTGTTGVVTGSVKLPCALSGKSVNGTLRGVLIPVDETGKMGLVGHVSFADSFTQEGATRKWSVKRSVLLISN